MRLPRRELLLAVGIGVGGMLVLRGVRPPGDVVEAPELVTRVLANDAPSEGSGDAEATLALFTDFRCPACRAAHGAMVSAARDAGARLIYRDWPILGPPSLAAARVALAAPRAIYPVIHDMLMRGPRIDEMGAMAAVAAAGGDPEAARAGASDAKIDALLQENANLAFALGLRGTPGYLAGPVRAEGALNENGFARLIERGRREARRQG